MIMNIEVKIPEFHYVGFPEIDAEDNSYSIEVGVVIDGQGFEGYYEFERGVWYVHFGGDTFGHRRMDADEIEKWFYLNKEK